MLTLASSSLIDDDVKYKSPRMGQVPRLVFDVLLNVARTEDANNNKQWQKYINQDMEACSSGLE